MQNKILLSAEHQQALEELCGMDRRNVKRLFRESVAPSMEEMNGEYAAELLDQGTRLANWMIRRVFRMSGNWVGKAFQGIAPESGIGYNYYFENGQKVKRLPMLTHFEETSLAAGKSFILDYSLTTRGLVRSMRGQIRRWQEGVYIGFGAVGPAFGRGDKLRRKIPFALVGPTHPFELPEDLMHLQEVHQRRNAA